MTTNSGNDHTANSESLPTVCDDELARTTGGVVWPGGPGGYGGHGGYGGNGGYGGPGGNGYQSYTVQPGDNLTEIARNAGHSLDYILGLNPQFQKNPNLIHPGQQVNTGRSGRWWSR